MATDINSASQSQPARPTRPELLLDHIARYGLTTRAIASRLFCESSSSKTENLFGRLLKQRRIVARSLRRHPPASYYTLAAPEAVRLHAPVPVGRLSGKAIYEALAVLYFCHEEAAKRVRISGKLLETRLGFPLKSPSATFVIQDEPEQLLGRIIVPGRDARPDYALKLIQLESAYLSRFPEAKAWMQEGTLRFVVLVYSEPRRAQFVEAIALARSRGRIGHTFRADVAVVSDAHEPNLVSKETLR